MFVPATRHWGISTLQLKFSLSKLFEIYTQGQGPLTVGQALFRTLPLFLLWSYAPVYFSWKAVYYFFCYGDMLLFTLAGRQCTTFSVMELCPCLLYLEGGVLLFLLWRYIPVYFSWKAVCHFFCYGVMPLFTLAGRECTTFSVMELCPCLL